MSTRYPSVVTVKSQTDKVNHRIEIYTEQLELINLCLPIIAKYEGKPISAHIATAINKELAKKYDLEKTRYNAVLDRAYGMFHIVIYGRGENNSTRRVLDALLGHSTGDGLVNMEKIKGHVCCYTLNEGRIKKLKEGLGHIRGMVMLRDDALYLFSQLNKLAEKYEMDYDFDLDKK